AHDEFFSQAMFDLLDSIRKRGEKIETLALFHEDTIFGTDSANTQLKLAGERGYKIVTDIKYRANSPSLTAEVQQLKAANADVLLPSSYTTDGILLVKTMNELGYKPRARRSAPRSRRTNLPARRRSCRGSGASSTRTVRTTTAIRSCCSTSKASL